MDTESQEKRILQWLKKGKTITAMEALKWYDCFRLSARIYNLKRNNDIRKKMVVTRSGKNVAQYYLIEH